MTFGRHRNSSPWFLGCIQTCQQENSENKETKNDGMDVNEDCVDGKEISENKEFFKKYPTCEEWDNGSENGE